MIATETSETFCIVNNFRNALRGDIPSFNAGNKLYFLKEREYDKSLEKINLN